MMEFRTPVKIDSAPFSIPPFERMLFVGSCFADHIGRKFLEEKFEAVVNPYGVMYNPASIWHTVERCGESPNVAVMTLGTNRVYLLKSSGEIVDNCRKRPAHLFEERSLTIDECVDYLSRAVDILIERNPSVKVIITVSPIRYAKYGFHGSQLSKATLLLAADRVVSKYSDRMVYFPAYEIVNDELRDYRFYQPDMLHPTEQAVDYIWQRLSEAFFHADTHTFIKEWKPIKNALAHRPFDAQSEAYKELMAKTADSIRQLEQKYGRSLSMVFSDEIDGKW